MEPSPVDVVRAFVEACWNHADEQSTRRLASPALADRLWAFAERVRTTGPDLRVTIDLVTTGEEGWVGVLQSRTQTHTGPGTGPLIERLTPQGFLPPTGQVVTSRSAAFYRVENGVITELIAIADNLEYFSNFGKLHLVLEEPGTGG
jgi:hypothetical protein